MKKFLVVALALMMVFSTSVCVMADTYDKTEPFGPSESAGFSSSGSIDVTVNDFRSVENVYYVTVEWSETDMMYSFYGEKTWTVDEEYGHSYTYSDPEGGTGWIDDTAKVTVTNHSNVAVEATVNEVGVNTLTYEIAPSTLNIEAAEEDSDYDEASSDTAIITAVSVPQSTEPITDNFVVNITAAADESVTPEEPEYVYETIGASDSYWEDELSYSDITTNTLISFYMSNYVYELDSNEENDAYINYEVKSVICEAASDKLVEETVSDETYYRFTEAGEYEVAVTFHNGYANTDITKTLTITVTE